MTKPAFLAAATLAGAALICATAAENTPERPPIVGIAYIALETNDSAAARHFYGDELGFDDLRGGNGAACFKVNDHQYIEVSPGLKSETQDRFSRLAFETTDARRLRDYLAKRGVSVPETVPTDQDGNLTIALQDPDGHSVEFVQYAPGSVQSKSFGKLLSTRRVSQHMIHAGMTVQDRAKADSFYKDILGFQLMWYGGMKDTRTDWVDMRVPDGRDWLEYMLNVHNPSPRQLGVMNHLALGVRDIQVAYKEVLARGMQPPEPPKIGRDGKWQLNLYDPNYTRAELMEFKPVQTACCSPMLVSFK